MARIADGITRTLRPVRAALVTLPVIGKPVGNAIDSVRAKYRKLRGFHAPVGGIEVTCEEAAEAGVGSTDIGAMLLGHTGRKVQKWTDYLAPYEEQFEPYRQGFLLADGSHRPLRFLEIGVSHGGSLQLWRKYFGADALIWGIDVNPECAKIDDVDLEIRIGSQDDPGFLRRVVSEMGGVDIVLDDGSHVARQQRSSFATLFPLLSNGGLYAVEDLHTSYWPEYGGGYGRRGAFVETVKNIIDDMHHWHHIRPLKVLGGLDSGASRVSIYGSIAFIQKAPIKRPTLLSVGEESF